MVYKKHARDDSDFDYRPARKRHQKARAASPPPVLAGDIFDLPKSSPPPESPSSPTSDHADMDDISGPLPSLLRHLTPEVQADWNVQTPSKRAHSVEPPASSPMSVMDPDPVTPTKPKRGRPVFTPVTRKLTARLSKLGRRTIQTPEISQETKTIMDQIHERRTTKQEAAAAAAKLKEEEEERVAAAERRAILIEKTKRVQELVQQITESQDEGGFGFDDLNDFFTSMWASGNEGDAQISANLSRYLPQRRSSYRENWQRYSSGRERPSRRY
ncbi:hypothetical protein C8J57DRAFT_1220994 [Mycena rebaudengoi]|nr:hypothetical protein C8J57DRAFT_1220994 [Mycena rebaudengoi]